MPTTLSLVPALHRREREWAARSLSLALHVGLIGVAVWLTQAPRPRADSRGIPDIPLTWTPRGRVHAPAPPQPSAPAPPGAAFAEPIPAPAFTAVDVPPPDAAAALPAEPLPGPTAAPAPIGPPAPPPAAPMDVRLVEDPPVLLSHPSPGYPELLRRAGIEGSVTVEAVLDTAGRVERGSIRVVASTQALFVSDATALVLGSRYRPARFGGRPVRVRIQVPVIFALRR